MEDLRYKWEQLGTGIKIGIIAAVVIVGGFFVFKILPYLIGALGLFALVALFFIPYFLPTIIAFARKHPSKLAILAVNLIFGWTFIGWVVSLVWSLSNNSSGAGQTVIVNNHISAAVGDSPVANVQAAPPVYAIGDVVNGHRFDGVQWVALEAAPQPAPPQLASNAAPQQIAGSLESVAYSEPEVVIEEARIEDPR